MHFFIESARSSLLTSKACLPPCPSIPIAQFSLNGTDIEVGEELVATNQSTNTDQFNWFINGIYVSNAQDLNHTFDMEGDYTIRLAAGNGLVECNEDIFEMTVTVTCPVMTGYVHSINGDWLVFNDMSTNASSLQWTVKDGSGGVLFTSSKPSDSLNITNLEYIQLCQLTENGLCGDQKCEYIQLIADGIEICNNQLDDDGDGMVDFFDQDCPCNDNAYQAFCPLDCEYLPDSFPAFEMKVKWVSEIISDFNSASFTLTVGDIDADGIVEVVSPKAILSPTPIGETLILNGGNGTTELRSIYSSLKYCLADIDLDGNAEIFLTKNDTLLSLDHDGLLLWKSDKLRDFRGQINIIDFNGDGIPELYTGNEIINSQNGKLLLNGVDGYGCYYFNVWTPCLRSHTLAAELIPDSQGLELAAGNTVYRVELNNLSGTSGNVITPIVAPTPVVDGVTSLGDINEDGQLDVIVVAASAHPDGGGFGYGTQELLRSLPLQVQEKLVEYHS